MSQAAPIFSPLRDWRERTVDSPVTALFTAAQSNPGEFSPSSSPDSVEVKDGLLTRRTGVQFTAALKMGNDAESLLNEQKAALFASLFGDSIKSNKQIAAGERLQRIRKPPVKQMSAQLKALDEPSTSEKLADDEVSPPPRPPLTDPKAALFAALFSDSPDLGKQRKVRIALPSPGSVTAAQTFARSPSSVASLSPSSPAVSSKSSSSDSRGSPAPVLPRVDEGAQVG